MAKPLSADEKRASLRLIRSDNVGPVAFRNLLAIYGTASAAVEALPNLAKNGGKRGYKVFPADLAAKECDQLAALGGEITVLGEPDYPALLAGLKDSQPVLAALGRLALASKKTVAVVGARECSLSAKKFAVRLGAELAEAGLTVVSGLALGIDGAAHSGALSASRGGTAAVLGTGVDTPYPPQNRELYRQIAARGLIVSEFPLGAGPERLHFPRRNRTLAGMAAACVVVEAQAASGSLITAQYAAEYGRPVMAVPGFPGDHQAAGANRLLQNGAKLVTCAGDVLDMVSSLSASELREDCRMEFQSAPPPKPPTESDMAGLREAIAAMLSKTPVHPDEIIAETKADSRFVLTALTELELAGRITHHQGGTVSLNHDI
ncbi:DNA processing protein DprA [Alphaproteobacteria bacterium]|nr:DNA processing protein DprA [Alphaproteobacteria bacterium]